MNAFLPVIVVALSVGALVGCASVPERLGEQYARADYRRVVADGRAYLDAKPGAPDAEDVRRLVSQAGYALAREKNTIDGYRAFRTGIEGWREAIFERKESLIQEAEVAFNGAAKTNSPEAYIEFRRRYPKSPRLGDSVGLEVGAAFGVAERGDTVSGWQSFLSKYGSQDEAEDYVARARRNEAAASFRALQKGATGAAVAAYRVRYAGLFDERKLGAFERKVLFREARQSDTLESYASLRKRYGRTPAAAPGLIALRNREIALVRAAERRPMSVPRCQAIFDEYARWPEVGPAVDAIRPGCARHELMALAQRQDDLVALEAFSHRYGHYDDVIPALSDVAERLYALQPSGERTEGDAWWKDSRTLHALYSPMIPFLPNEADSRREARERKAAFGRTQRDQQRRQRGAEITLGAVRVLANFPEVTLSKKGRKRVVRLVRKMKGHPGLGPLFGLEHGDTLDRLGAYYMRSRLKKCRRCLVETGRYVVRAEVPVPVSVSGYGHLTGDPTPEGSEAAAYAAVAGIAEAPARLRWWALPGTKLPLIGPASAFAMGATPPTTYSAGPVALLPVRVEFVVPDQAAAEAIESGAILPFSGRIDGLRVVEGALELRLQ